MTRIESLLALRDESIWTTQQHSPSLNTKDSTPSYSQENADYYDNNLKAGCCSR